MSTNNNVDASVMDLVVDFVQLFITIRVRVKARDASFWENTRYFLFKQFSAEAFVVNAGVLALRAGRRHWEVAAAGMATHLELICMKN